MKNINIQISDELHHDLRVEALMLGMTLKDVVILHLVHDVNHTTPLNREKAAKVEATS